MCLGAASHKAALGAAEILVAGKYECSIPGWLGASEEQQGFDMGREKKKMKFYFVGLSRLKNC